MPKKGPAYPISEEWQERVRARIDEMGISQNEFARRARLAQSSLSEALAKGAVQTTCMPQIHKALGWPVPPLVLSPDALELQSLYDQMPELERGRQLESAKQTVERLKRTKSRQSGT